MKRLTSTILTALIAAATVIAVAPNADAACRYARDYDRAGRLCGKRSAEMRGPTTGYDRSGGGGGSLRNYKPSAATAAKLRQQSEKSMAAIAAKSKIDFDKQVAKSKLRKAEIQREVDAWQARSQAESAAWIDGLCAELNLKVCR